MSKQIEQIRAEIERRFWDFGTPLHDDEVTKKVDEILSFIDTIPEEEPSEDLEKVAKPLRDFIRKNYHPHTIVVVDWDGVNLYEATKGIPKLTETK